LARYGLKDGALKILTGLFEAANFLDLHRLPELFCGFERRPGEGPTRYPVACSPQAWSAAAAFQLVQACLGVCAGPRARVSFHEPTLPKVLTELEVRRLRVEGGAVDLLIHRYRDGVSVNMLRRQGDVVVSVVHGAS
jgi:glycogen debranching enzyme